MEKPDNQKGIVHLIIILIIALGIIAGVYLVQHPQIFRSKATLEGIDLSLQPSQITATPNGELTLSVFANTKDFSVTAAEIHISFDPNLVEVRNIQKADRLGVVLQIGQVTNNEAKIILGVSPGASFIGNATIATLTVVPKIGLTSTTLQFTNQTRVAAINNQNNVVGSLNPVIITLPLPSPSPSPSSSPTASPSPLPSSTNSPSPLPFLISPSPSSTRSTTPIPTTRSTSSQSQSPIPSPTSISTSKVPPKTPTQVEEPPSAFQLIQQRNTQIITIPTPSFSPSPTPSPEGKDITQVVTQIPVLREVINLFVSTIDRIFNFWKIR